MPEENEVKETKKANVVEKRVGSTIIRRRKVKAPPKPEPKPEEEVVAAEAAESAGVESTEKVEVPKEILAVEKPAEEVSKETPKETAQDPKRRGLKIIAQPEDVVAQPVAPEADKSKDRDVKRPARKRLSKAEIQYEDIRKHGGLKQYARGAGVTEGGTPLPERSRVFRPGATRRKKKGTRGTFKKTQLTEKKAIKKVIKIDEAISVSNFSQAMGIKAQEIIKKLMDLGIMSAMNQPIDIETATLIATEYGYEVEHAGFKEEDALQIPEEKREGLEKKSRPPVVTVMGHVDHGKTSILDIIRQANVADGEAGGITQHIGAYTVQCNGQDISFVDTPGHEAFTHMRARGAQVTDIVILVVAADDGVMPQTREAIDHSKAAGVQIIVAINKIDKPNADQDRVRRELTEVGLQPEDWGGETICVPTSAKTKEGIDKLLEMVLLQAEILELKAAYEGRAKGIILESRMDRRRGPVVTAIVKEGTLRQGDPIVAGAAAGKARALVTPGGGSVKEVYPSQPVEILGLTEVPEAGEHFVVVEDDKVAKEVSENRLRRQREDQLSRQQRVTLEDFRSKLESGETTDLNVIIKTDVKGVADAVKDSLPGLSTQDVEIKVLHTGVGGINEGDIMLAAASNAVVLGFNVVADVKARELAERENIEIKTYSIIYEMLEDIKKAIAGMLAPKEVEKVLGRALVKEPFKVPKIGVIAGSQVTNGKVTRNSRIRLLRDNVIIHDGQIASLRRFKDDVREVANGLECGIGIEKFQDVKPGDEIEAYIIEEIKVTWEENKQIKNMKEKEKKEAAAAKKAEEDAEENKE